jgi:hypothetical protein
MTKREIFERLRHKFPEREFALMEEVRDAAGFNASRSADYIAVGLWPSRGLAVHGIELKKHRGDWLGELKNPRKAENIYQYCDHFWLLTGGDSVAKIEEIPISWGWMCIRGSIIKIMKPAPSLNPVPLSKNIIATMLKRAQDKSSFVHIDSIKEKIDDARLSGKAENKSILEDLQRQLSKLREEVNEFEKASGIQIRDNWNFPGTPKEKGEAVKYILGGRSNKFRKEILQAFKEAEKATRFINKLAKDWCEKL